MIGKTLKHMFLWPGVIGLLTLAGLILALVEDNFLEDIALIALAFPLAVIAYFYLNINNKVKSKK